jgi:hypothetical protein
MCVCAMSIDFAPFIDFAIGFRSFPTVWYFCVFIFIINKFKAFYALLSNKEEFEDIKVVIRIHKSKTNRQHNGQYKSYKRTNNDLQNIHIKLMIEKQEAH